MANLSKIKRDKMIAFLEQLKEQHSDDESIRAFNEIENQLRDKKYGLVWEEHSEAVDEMLEENIPVFCADPERRLCKDPSLPWNFIIEGDNLQALYLLEKTHRGKVDCIYIDPPYNTGAHDWKYNNDYVDSTDAYRHSKWLSMMKNRLLLAKHLLNPNNSVLIVTIDEKEYLHLGCLLEELFPTSNIQMISSVINPKGNRRDNQFSRCEEYIYFVYIGNSALISNGNDMLRDDDSTEDNEDKSVRLRALLRQASNHGKRTDRPNLFYPILFDKKSGKFLGHGPVIPLGTDRNTFCPPKDSVAMWPIGSNGTELTWNLQPETLMDKHSKHFLSFGKWDGKQRTAYYLSAGQEENFYKGLYNVVGIDSDGAYIIELKTAQSRDVRPLTIWHKKTHSASEYGTSYLNKIIGSNRFSFPKSIYAVQDTINFFVADKPNAIIVDFFSGSGTTLHAINLINACDNGNRTCIMVTNNEVSENEAKELKKHGIHAGDAEWEELGIAKYVTWPRTVCTIEGHDINPESSGLSTSWFSGDHPDHPEEIKKLNGHYAFLLFKQAIATGWDCPRAKILVKLREGGTERFNIQTVGRIRRMPERTHYNCDLIDNCYLYTLDSQFTEGLTSSLGDSFYTYQYKRKFTAPNLILQKEALNGSDRFAVNPRAVVEVVRNAMLEECDLDHNGKLDKHELEVSKGYVFGIERLFEYGRKKSVILALYTVRFGKVEKAGKRRWRSVFDRRR